jgi:hypothetical protein
VLSTYLEHLLNPHPPHGLLPNNRQAEVITKMPLKITTVCQAADIISRKVAEVGIIKNTTYQVWSRETWRGTREWRIEISGDIGTQRVWETIVVSTNNRAFFYDASHFEYKCLFFGKQHIDDLAAVTAALLVGNFFAHPLQQKFKIWKFFTINRAFAKSIIEIAEQGFYGLGRAPIATLGIVFLRNTKEISVRLECPVGVLLHDEPIILSDPATASKILNGLVCELFL